MTLDSAKKAASAVRFSADHPGVLPSSRRGSHEFKDALLRSGLVVDGDITPGIDKKLKQVCQNLSVPHGCVTAFIYADPNIQAASISLSESECILQFSSALINQLDEEEVAFVMGHELGHFILEHEGMHINDMDPAGFAKNRAKEISADRLGLLGCADLNASLRAMIKTVSGLESRLLRFDVNQFLSQVDQLSNPDKGEALHNTHPSILVRARSLLWFSSTNIHNAYPNNVNNELVEEVNQKVQKDLDKYVDAGLKKRIDEVKSDIVMWLASKEILADRVFDDDEKDKLTSLFGKKVSNKLALFVEKNGVDKTISHAQKQLEVSCKKLKSLTPHNFDATYIKLQEKVRDYF